MPSKRAFAIAALCIACGTLSVTTAVAQDEVFVAVDGVNTGTIGAYDVSFGSGTASGSTVNASLITTPPAGASTEVRMSLATDGLGDLFVGEWASGTTATVGEYSMNGTAINSSLLTLSDSVGAPQLAADAQGQLFVAVGGTVSEYTTGGTLLNSFNVAPVIGGEQANISISALAVDGSGNLYASYSIGTITLGYSDNGVISEYTASGSPIDRRLITTPHDLINSIAVGGGDIFVSISDTPPDILNRIDEYTTSGSLVMTGLIHTSGHLALDGQGNLLVANYGVGTVDAFTTSGSLLNSSVISGVVGAEDIVVVPVPEPSAFALLAFGAAGLFIWGRLRGTGGSAVIKG